MEEKKIVICVLTEIAEKIDGVSFGSIDDFCKELAIYSDKINIFFYVSSLKRFQKQEGYIYKENSWHKIDVPYPHVIHNRIHSRKSEHTATYKNLIEELTKKNVPVFNERFLNKWEVHTILESNEYLQPYLPDTKLLTSKHILNGMLETYECIFAKPIHGSQGRNIFRISKQDDNLYYLDHTTFSGEIESVYQNFNTLFQALKSRISQQAYIIQNCLPLLSYKDKPLDFRILCQKNTDEKWKITSAISRISSKDQFVSNLARGGEIMKVNEVLLENFDIKAVSHIKKIMQEIALEVASVIDISTDGIFAELGIDLALDPNGKPTIIEVNTKPSKNQDQIQDKTTIRPSAKAIIHHCCYLASQNVDE